MIDDKRLHFSVVDRGRQPLFDGLAPERVDQMAPAVADFLGSGL